MKSRKYQNIIFVISVSLLIIFMIYTFSGEGNGSIFAYPSSDLIVNSAGGYPIPPEYPQPLSVGNMSSYPAPIQPIVLPVPLLTPTPNLGAVNMTSLLTIQENKTLDHQLVSPGQEQIPNVTVTTKSLTHNGALPSMSPVIPSYQLTNSDLVDNWDLLFDEGFEGSFPQAGCAAFDNYGDDWYERYWGPDDYRPLNGEKAAWPARNGIHGVEPMGNYYPDNLDSWLLCGPFDLSQADKFIVQYSFWHEITDIGSDSFFFGISTDGTNFQGTASVGTTPGWIVKREHIHGVAGNSAVWLAWVFESGIGGSYGEGAWIDDLQVWRYNTPATTCGNADPGDKGMVLSPYDPTIGGELPIIRAGDTVAVDALKSAGVDWVRLEFIQRNGSIDWQGYDRMVDTLCANGISTLGLLNHDLLMRQDFEDPIMAAGYRSDFADVAGFIADYYEGRITYWEVWNEPNLGPDSGNPPYIAPARYAPLLEETYQAIKNGNPQAQVLFGGLASAWDDVNQYFTNVYNEFGGNAPFDYFAIHPYSNGRVEHGGYGVDPQVYLHADPDDDTILDKFAQTMYSRGDGNKKMWITEIGWNSSLYSPNKPGCKIDLTTEEEQANFLKPAFDILWSEVHHWNTTTDAVEKVVWYQYMDVGVGLEEVCPTANAIAAGGTGNVSINTMTTGVNNTQADWWFGIYRGDKTSPKQVWCEYFSYPLTCDQLFTNKIYLPIIVKP